MSEEESSEAHLPTKRPTALEAPRFQVPDGDPSRSCSPAEPPPQGSGSPVGLIVPLRDRRTLRTVRSDGRRGRSGPVTVRALPSSDGPCQVAFAIGRRTGSAVVRNRIRRRLRAALGELAGEGLVPPGALLVMAGAPVATTPFTEVRSDLARAIQRARP